MIQTFLKLRGNIELESDVDIAAKECKNYVQSLEYINVNRDENVQLPEWLGEETLCSNTRKDGCIGFVAEVNPSKLIEISTRLSFIQEIWVSCSDIINEEVLNVKYGKVANNGILCIVPLFCMAELLSNLKKNSVSHVDIEHVLAHLSNNIIDKDIAKSIFRQSSTPHVHSLHKYKAKFFPRLVRSFINNELPIGKFTVLDPFVGSGTAVIESSFLGFESIGVDIDKLSCLISESKSDLLSISSKEIQNDIKTYYTDIPKQAEGYTFPSWISRKFQRNNAVEEQQQYESEITKLVTPLKNGIKHKKLFQTLISDSVSRKFNIRMMGTGVGRFALEIQKTPLLSLFTSNVKTLSSSASVVEAIRTYYNIELTKPTILNGDATNLSIPDSSVDLIITSPPYLPASSGREDYIIGKSVSITALGILSESEIKSIESVSVGSMTNQMDPEDKSLPNAVIELYNWLKADSLRNIKAEPTLAYYRAIKKSLNESFRVLKPNCKAIYVIGKESVFYNFKSRDVLFKVQCDDIFCEIAEKVGFKIKERFDVELNKKNRNARPRSLDKYYESVITLEKA